MPDALVVGGGPAGLSAALVLARALHTVTVVDGDAAGVKARSTWPQVNRNLLGWPDGLPAHRLRELGHEQLGQYDGVRLLDDRVTGVEAADGGFVATTRGGERVGARVVLLATGVADHYPLFEGWHDLVGRSLHWCIACDGYETRGRPVVVVGADATAALDALQLRRMTDRVALVTQGPATGLSPEHRALLADAGVAVVASRLTEAVTGAGGDLVAVRTADGDEVPAQHVFGLLPATPRAELARSLGVDCSPEGFVCVDTDQRTPVEGVFAAGDLTRVHSHQLATALHEGTQAGHAMNHALLPAAWR